MKILVTGSKGFLGKNLVQKLIEEGFNNIIEFTHSNNIYDLDYMCKDCDFVFHFAAVQRPNSKSDYIKINYTLTDKIISALQKHNNNCPILFSSSIQAELDNEYGECKRQEERILKEHSIKMNSNLFIYRFPNIFGKGAKPNYTSVIATFCYNISHKIPITINDPSAIMRLVYLEDVLNSLICVLKSENDQSNNILNIRPVYKVELGWLAFLIGSFKNNPVINPKVDMNDELTIKLYETYLTYTFEKLEVI